MTDLNTRFLGLPLINPVVAASGPWTGNAARIQAAIDAGAGAVITETIALEEYHRCYPRVYYRDGEVMSTSLYGTLSLEQWESEMEQIQKGSCKLIASIRGGTPSELAYIAKKVERMGADALQLDLYAPVGSMIFGLNNDAEQLVSLVTAVKRECSIPIMVRLPHYVADNARFMRALEKCGVDGITMIESIRCILGVDIDKAMPLMPTHGAYSGCHVRPITLAAIAALSQVSNLPISATGGTEDYRNIVEAIELGATTVQLGSAVLLNGYSVITTAVEELSQWMNQHGYANLQELQGKALKSLFSYEELDGTRRAAQIAHPQACTNCGLCINSCLANAISFDEDGKLQVNVGICDGCGLCCSVCSHQVFCMA